MAAISAGEFERIFKEFYKPLCLFALRFTEKTEDAEDVVQQVFADVWDKNSHDMVIANFKSYLYQAVRNRSLTLIAQSSDMLQTTECIADIEDLSEEEQIYQSERDARLWAAIDGLPAERKKIFLLSKRDGLKYQEIAEELHISIKTVENQMGKAMISSESILFAVVFVLMFVLCGYLLIYNIFDISVMQDVRQYGLLRMIGTSTRQIKSIVNRQAVWLTLIGLPIGLIAGFFAGRALLPVVMRIFSYEYSTASLQASASPMLFVIAALFTILTVFISTRKPAKKASKVSPMEAIRYTEQDDYKKKTVTRISGAKLSHMAFSNLGRNRRRCVFIVVSMLLCIVLFNSIIIVTQSMDEEKWITRTTKTDFTVYNSIAVNVQEGFRHH